MGAGDDSTFATVRSNGAAAALRRRDRSSIDGHEGCERGPSFDRFLVL
jgi:hypothetical protein